MSGASKLLLAFVAVGASNVIDVARGGPSDAPARRPSFVVMYADDWRWDALGVVQREQGDRARFPWLQTPRLDELAAQSVRFRQAFVVNSLCSPARACVLTGRYSHANGVIDNRTPLPTDAETVASRLRDAGYATAYCGKWHMDSQRDRPGFDFVASFVGQGRYVDCPIMLNGRRTETRGWVDDVSTDYAIEFLQQQPADGPFFLFLGFKSSHGPRGGRNLPERVRDLYASDESRPAPNADALAPFQNEPAKRQRGRSAPDARRAEGHRNYMRHITAIDHCVGRVLDALAELGRADNTIVLVAGDNGYYLGEHGLSDKRSAYEESIRVPLLLHVPGRQPGVVDAMALNVDYAPTLLDYAGAAPLDEAHGRSLRPLIDGKASTEWRTAFLYEYFKERRYASPTVLAVRTTTHKLITYPGHDDWTEAYDLANDPYETKNLALDAALVKALEQELEAQKSAVDFHMPQQSPARRDRE